jgi:N-acetylmuramoyl-L-alanine amidase
LLHLRRLGLPLALAALAVAAAAAARQAGVWQAAPPFTVIAADGRHPLPATQSGDQVMIALDDLAALFQLTVREDALAGGVTVGYKGKTVILTQGQALASAAGRLVSLPAPPVRDGRRWLVPVEFINRAIGPVYDRRLDVRKNARLVLVGDVRVPHVTVRPETLGPQTRLTFTVSPRTPYAVAQEAGRLVIRFEADALDIAVPPVAPTGLLQSIRVADAGASIAIDLGPRFGSFRSSMVPQDDGAQVLVDLMPSSTEAPAPPPARGGVTALPGPAVPELPVPPAAGELRTIVIDPGHGGDETGAKGGTGTLEKDIALAVARKLKAALEGRLGVRVLLTRDGDQAVALDERAALANNNKANLFVSLHANASARSETSGAQMYYLAGDRQGGDGRTVAASLPALGGGVRDIELVPWEIAQLRHAGDSALLAGAIAEQMRGRVRLSPQPVVPAPVRVLASANMPAVLVEIGFLSNPDEVQQLASDAYQASVAQAILDGILRFRELASQVPHGAATVPLLDPRRRP